MKITAALSGVDAYEASCDAGADEVFCGYVPEEWMARYGLALPLNRREARLVNAQVGGRGELLLLAERAARRRVPVTLAFNALYYAPEQYPLLGELMARCAADGFRAFIVADMGLLVYLHSQGLDRAVRLHVSGELGEMNRGAAEICRSLGAERIILHRHVTIGGMASLIRADRALHPDAPMEFEAFALNELCHFHGGFCQSLHCDELAHMCRVPYRLGGIEGTEAPVRDAVAPADWPGIGGTGCGLCALWRLRQAGVTHLKLVGRGNVPQETLRDIAALRRAADLAQGAPDEAGYLAALRRALFPDGCGGNCYYFGETRTIRTEQEEMQ